MDFTFYFNLILYFLQISDVASSIIMLLILFTEFDFSPLYGFNLWWIIDILEIISDVVFSATTRTLRVGVSSPARSVDSVGWQRNGPLTWNLHCSYKGMQRLKYSSSAATQTDFPFAKFTNVVFNFAGSSTVFLKIP